MEPGLSSPATFRHRRGAAVRPTDPDSNAEQSAARQGSYLNRFHSAAALDL